MAVGVIRFWSSQSSEHLGKAMFLAVISFTQLLNVIFKDNFFVFFIFCISIFISDILFVF